MFYSSAIDRNYRVIDKASVQSAGPVLYLQHLTACLYQGLYIGRPLTGREKMATAGGRHVMESYGEVNDRLAVIPEAMMEIGHTHIYLLTTHACVHAPVQRRMSGK